MAELHWNAEALRARLASLLPGVAVEVVATTGSTSTDLLERARTAAREMANDTGVQIRRSIESGAYAGGTRADGVRAGSRARDTDSAMPSHFTPCLRVAERQTAGRGRMGRTWHAEPGASLTYSLALELGAADWSGLSLAVGVALAEALDPAVEGRAARIALKWPNDLWLLDEPSRGRKLGGVLIESIPFGAQRVAVVGVGLNVLPVAVRADFASGYACIHELAPSASAPALLAEVAPALVEALRLFERSGFAAFHQRYAKRDLLFGHAVRTSGAEASEGVADGVTSHGALILRAADGQVRQVVSGEVSVRLAGPANACDDAPVPSLPAATRC